MILFVRECVSECVSKVPHSFIMSSKCEEQKRRDEQRGEVGTKETTEAVDIVCLLFSFPMPTLVLCYCCLSGRHEAR